MADITDPRLVVMDHPLVQHKLSILRDKSTPTKIFRELVTELSVLEGYEALRDLPLEDVEVETPLEVATCKRIAGMKLAIIPILRAGLGMVDGILQLVPSARVGHVGLERDHETHKPRTYYCKFPRSIAERTCLVVDPMLATGGSLIAAIKYLREAGVKDIRCLTLVSCPEGVKAVLDADSDVRLYTCVIDRELNENAYILPGLGDAGDRIYGTK
jgi:uracil phosphoribosyltransferase